MRGLRPHALHALAFALAIASAPPLQAQFQQSENQQRGIFSPMNPAPEESTAGQRHPPTRSTRGRAQREATESLPVAPLPDGWEIKVLGPFSPASTYVPGVRSNSLGRLQARASRSASAATGQGTHFAFVQANEGRQRVVLDGVPGQAFDAVFDLLFSADGKHFVYVANENDGSRLVVDGVPGPPCPRIIPTSLRMSPDGRRVAYIVLNDGKMQVICDGQPRREFDYIGFDSIVFSADSQHFAYAAQEGGSWYAVIDDGKDGAHYNGGSGLVLSPDGSRLAFVRQSGDLAVVVVDGKSGANFDNIQHLAFTPDGKNVNYLAERAGKMCVGWNLTPTPLVDEILPPGLILSPDGEKKLYVARVGRNWRIMDGAKAGPDFEAIGPLVFSADGKRMAYSVRRGERNWMQLDASALPDFPEVRNPVFSPDGKRFGYIAQQRGKKVVMLDGLPSKEYERIVDGSLRFNRDGTRLAWVVQEGTGRNVRERVVVDDVAGPQTTQAVAGPVWRDDGALEFLAPTTPVPEEGSQLTRFTVPPPGK